VADTEVDPGVAPSAPPPRFPRLGAVRQHVSLSRLQAIVGLVAGVISVGGAAYTFFVPSRPPTGTVVAIVQDARSEKPVPDATVEVLTLDNAVVTTLSSDAPGRARYALREGAYRLRVTHPRFGAEVRQVMVQAGQTSEVRVKLAPRTAASPDRFSPVGAAERAVNEGAEAIRRLFR
jgi:hypothetical protein